MSATHTGYVPVHGGQLYYEVTGTGPAVLFIHAGVADCTMWDEQVPAFAPHYQVIRYDTRGFGKTTSANVMFSNRQDVLDLLTHLGVAQAAVIGLSRGSQIALDFTLEHPQRVSALVCVAGGVSGYDGGPPSPTEERLFNETERLWQARDFSTLIEHEIHVWADGPSQPVGRAPQHVRDRLRSMITANYTHHTEALQPILLDPPAANRLAEISVPTLVIVGDYDTTDTCAAMAYAAQQISGAAYENPHGVAHMVNMEMPDWFNERVLAFLAASALR